TNPYSFVKENAFLEGDDLVLKVNGIPKGSRDIIKSAQVEFKNLDFMYGSYRINAAVPKAEGACFGFFYYFNDTQEIDAELVNSPDYQNQIQFSTHLNSPRHPTGKITAIQKPFINDEKYHEFGFDVYPDGVSFFLNGESTNKFPAPTVAGNIVISYWGNGDKGWSGRPTQTDLVAKVKSLLIYYN
ncbi:concanavalin A-like lectin/glucanase domain-containing protein, partial [Globomyces pollinis-pini]